MKKRFAAAIAVMALLSGCDGNNGKSAVDTSESAAQTTESSAQTTTVPATTTTAAEPEAVVYDDGRAVLEYAGEYVVYETVFDESILADIGLDVELSEGAQWCIDEFVTPRLDEFNEHLSAEEKAELEKSNYINFDANNKYVIFDLDTQRVDSICTIRYRHRYLDGIVASRMFYIKDGKILKEIEKPSRIVFGGWDGVVFGDSFYFLAIKGLGYIDTLFCRLDLKTDEVEVIEEYLDIAMHISTDGNCIMITDNEDVKLYFPKTGEFRRTGIGYLETGMTDNLLRLKDGKIEYTYKNEGFKYDISSGEISAAPDLTPEMEYQKDGEFFVIQPMSYEQDANGEEDNFVEITRKSDGVTKRFDLNFFKGLKVDGYEIESANPKFFSEINNSKVEFIVYATTDRVRCWFDFDSETWGVLEAVTPAVDDENLKEKLKQFNKSDYTTAAEYFDHEIYLENPDGYTQKDIDFLKSLDLEFIYVYVNKPCDLSFLGELNTVCELSIQSAVMDLTPLETPTYIESYDFLKTMTGLETLWLYSGYSDFDLSMLNNLSKLDKLDLIGYNISGETRLENLNSLSLMSSAFSAETIAESFPSLAELEFYFIDEELDFTPFSRLESMKILELKHTGAKGIDSFSALINLETFAFMPLPQRNILLEDISFLKPLDNLKQFDTYKNVLSDEQKAQLLKWHSQCKITEYDVAI